MNSDDREMNLALFGGGSVDVLVCTDLAARGKFGGAWRGGGWGGTDRYHSTTLTPTPTLPLPSTLAPPLNPDPHSNHDLN